MSDVDSGIWKVEQSMYLQNEMKREKSEDRKVTMGNIYSTQNTLS